MKMLRMLALGLMTCVLAGSAFAQSATSPKAINTGGPTGAYNTQFCPPLPQALEQAYFQGHTCTPSKGSGENFTRVVATPTQVSFCQFDACALLMANNPDDAKKITIVRDDVAFEGLWMVTKNPRLKNFADVLQFAARIPFKLPAADSGAMLSFQYLKKIDASGLGRANNIENLDDATAAINKVAEGTAGEVAFFVQFADPESPNFKLIKEKGLTVIPVISREILNAKIGDRKVYEAQSFDLQAANIRSGGVNLVTASTAVVLITGNPDLMANDPAKADYQKELITTLRSIPKDKLLPPTNHFAKLMAKAHRLSDKAVAEALVQFDAARAAAAKALN